MANDNVRVDISTSTQISLESLGSRGSARPDIFFEGLKEVRKKYENRWSNGPNKSFFNDLLELSFSILSPGTVFKIYFSRQVGAPFFGVHVNVHHTLLGVVLTFHVNYANDKNKSLQIFVEKFK